MTILTPTLVDGQIHHEVTIGNDDGGDNVYAFAVPASGLIMIEIEEAADPNPDPIITRLRDAMLPCAAMTLSAAEARRLSAALAEAADLIEAGPGTNVAHLRR